MMKRLNIKTLVIWCALGSATIVGQVNSQELSQDGPNGKNIGPNSEGLNLTEYERQLDENTEPRGKIWRSMNFGQQPVTIGANRTRGSQSVDGRTMTDSWERINSYQDFTDLRNQVDDHEERLANLEVQVSDLENAPENWQPGPPEPGPFNPIAGSNSEWEPPISTQLADFTQSRTTEQTFERTVETYETNAVTGERRLIDSFTETDVRTSSESRLVDVANNPGGGTDGWSGWSNTSGVYNCSAYSPATSTRDQGVRFPQTRTCSQNQERFVYYLPEGDATTERRGTRVASVTQSRTATGTRVVAECRNTYLEIEGENTGWQDIRNNNNNSETVIWWGWTGTGFSTNPTRFILVNPTPRDPTEANPYIRDGYAYWRTNNSRNERIDGIRFRQFEVCRRRL